MDLYFIGYSIFNRFYFYWDNFSESSIGEWKLGIIKTTGVLFLAVSPFLLMVLIKPVGNYIETVYDEIYIDVENVGIVTDKWIRDEPAFWIFGSIDNYYIEVNDKKVEMVDAFTFYNTDVGSFRNWTTKELRSKYMIK